MLLAGVVEICSVKADDCDGEDKLQEAENKVQDQEREGRAAGGGDGGGWFLVEAGECHCDSFFDLVGMLSRAFSCD